MSTRPSLTAGFVLAGGQSTRMGRDKALLRFEGATLLETIAGRVHSVAGSVTVIGPPERYRHLGLNVTPDLIDGCGPLAGLYTALAMHRAEWNLVVACDMPNVTEEVLRDLLAVAKGDGVVPETTQGREPLCAVYHARVAAAAEAALRQKRLKMQEFISTLDIQRWPVSDPDVFANWNVPEQVNCPAGPDWTGRP